MKKIEFLNLDLDLESKDDLSFIIQELGDAVVVMNNEKKNGVYSISIELAGIMGTPAYLFNEYLMLINGLSDQSKKIWHGCIKKEFDLGFECGATSSSLQEKLPSELINALSELGVSVAITIYGPQ